MTLSRATPPLARPSTQIPATAYLYNAGERQAAARWLYRDDLQTFVYSKSGWWGRLPYRRS